MNIANNHMMQHGIWPFEETIRTLKNSGIGAVGLRGIEPFGCEPLVIQVGSEKVGFSAIRSSMKISIRENCPTPRGIGKMC